MNPLLDIPELAIYAHRPHPEYFKASAGSMVSGLTKTTRVLVWISPGSVHENMARAWEASSARYFAFVDEDVEFLDQGWLDVLIADLEANPSMAAVATAQVKEEEHKFDYEMWAENHPMETREAGLQVVKWAPAHVLLVDRSKVPNVTPDVNIPGVKGMSDLDFCLQIRAAGYEVGIDSRVVVYHPHKAFADIERLKLDNPTLGDEQQIFPQQALYMAKKWGTLYTELQPKMNPEWAARVKPLFDKEGLPFPW